MNVLALFPYLPYPIDSGGRLRSHYTLAALTASHRVTAVFLSDDSRPVEAPSEWTLYHELAEPPIVATGAAAGTEYTPDGRALRQLMESPWLGSPAWVALHDIPAFWNSLAKLPLDRFDVVQVRNMHMAPYGLAIRRRYPKMKFVLDLDDISSIARSRSIGTANFKLISVGRSLAWLDFLRLRAYEKAFLKRFDSVWVCSEEDRRRAVGLIGGAARVDVVPNVVDVSKYGGRERRAVNSQRILFVGELNRGANIEGVRYFCRDIWPTIRAENPEAEFQVVGRDPVPVVSELHNPGAGINVVGTVPDVLPHLESAAIMVVPLLLGTGTRLKILEAMAAGLPVVSTAIGAEGLQVTNSRDIAICDDPREFAEQCLALLRDAGRRAAMSAKALETVSAHYDVDAMKRTIDKIYGF